VAHWRAGPAALCVLLVACQSEAPRADDGGARAAASTSVQALQLTSADSWVLASRAEDPFIEYEAGRVRCSPFAIRPESTWLEVTTTDCNYATLAFTFSADVLPGSIVRGEVAWATLAALEPALGTLAFATAPDAVLWSLEVAIPGRADIVKLEFEVGQPLPAGTVLYFNVRNHGYNTWQLSPLTLDPPDDAM
jgi:hypothetical protein